VRIPSRNVLTRTAAVSVIAAIISVSLSTGIRMLWGVQSDGITIVVRLVLPFLIAIPIAFVWFTKLERLERSYRLLTEQTNNLIRSASTDPLTGLFNRRQFIDQFNQAMEMGIPGWFLIADIDYLKSINDNYGHLVGDEAVLATAKALETVLPKGSLVARIGGDEFCAFVPSIQEKEMLALYKQVSLFAAKLFKESVKAEGSVLSASIGIIVCKPKQTFAEVMALADERLYRKKRMRAQDQEYGQSYLH